eukprot:CAMPEP_0114514232 /NCGR_PEP_ID=MMETSP0109-20121206/16035_1 /TAXON_ID=29199 /ORGANISM="Chlorarachnion reptans, Strain CCCM449" /LENGTH=161 /DNA_ID=CAMNT_0001694241 /DNA_START=147 /DNA_END=629 /DNA_ORIENTATION=-
MPKKSSSTAPKKRKSTRVKSKSAKIRTLDSGARDRAIAKRLNRLEDDNYKEEVDLNDTAYVDGEEEELIHADSRKKKKKPKRMKLQPAKSLEMLTREANLDQYPEHIPTLLSIEAKPSKYPHLSVCSVSGNHSKYRCRTCGMKYSSVHTYMTHKETRCLCW